MTRSALLIAGVTLVALLGGGGAGRASAQEAPAGTMVIEFPAAATLDPPSEPRDLLGGSVTAFAGGVFCATFDFADGERFVIGAPDQPDACRVPGSSIAFVSGRGHLLVGAMEFQPGTTQLFDSLSPIPPHSSYPAHICAFLESVDIENTNCTAGLATFPSPITGSAGIATSGAASHGGVIAGLALATLLMVAARRSTAPGARRGR